MRSNRRRRLFRLPSVPRFLTPGIFAKILTTVPGETFNTAATSATFIMSSMIPSPCLLQMQLGNQTLVPLLVTKLLTRRQLRIQNVCNVFGALPTAGEILMGVSEGESKRNEFKLSGAYRE